MNTFCNSALSVIEIEGQAVLNLSKSINETFQRACETLVAIQGRIVVTGIGKSGHIGKKIASTLASTGSPAFFLHPAEAVHGDLGMLTSTDAVIALSHSGNTPEILQLIPMIKRLQIPLIALTGKPDSSLAQYADYHLLIPVEQEACPLGLAPTTSSTASLVMGDAIAIALLEAKGFSREDFALSHPGGALGKKLLLRAIEIAHTNDDLPMVRSGVTIRDALIEVTQKKLGMTCVLGENDTLLGVYTDGDIRRTLHQNLDLSATPIDEVMSRQCKTIYNTTLAAEALAIMQKYTITSLVIINEQNQPLGVVHLHDILRSGIY